MLAVCGLIKAMNRPVPAVVTTVFVRDDRTANVQELAAMIGVPMYYVNPGFDALGHQDWPDTAKARSRKGLVPEGAMFMASVMGFTPEQIQQKIFEIVQVYS